ncbi:MAG: hypothetical protein D6722_28985 [Bacteroidetes bacterium]|nr:MAG: hypothetical protein D6722_28985 [Bacteroidota bacterium]
MVLPDHHGVSQLDLDQQAFREQDCSQEEGKKKAVQTGGKMGHVGKGIWVSGSVYPSPGAEVLKAKIPFYWASPW